MSESMSESEKIRMQMILNYLKHNKMINSAGAAEALNVEMKTEKLNKSLKHILCTMLYDKKGQKKTV